MHKLFYGAKSYICIYVTELSVSWIYNWISHCIYLDQADLSGSEFHHCLKKVFLRTESAIVYQVVLILTLFLPLA